MRVDFNVPLDDHKTITDDKRIFESLLNQRKELIACASTDVADCLGIRDRGLIPGHVRLNFLFTVFCSDQL